ncbi:MAG: hypothetical protein ACOY46_15845 [Bacillota bacterium]
MNKNIVLGLRNIKTPQTLKINGSPREPLNQKIYLDLYVLEKEKHRLIQEILMLEEKINILQRRVDDITLKMGEYQKIKMKKQR